MKQNSGEVFFLLWSFFLLLSLQQIDQEVHSYPTIAAVEKQEPARTIVTCSECAHVPEWLTRLDVITLPEGPTIWVPTQDYLTYLDKTCDAVMKGYSQNECSRRLKEIQFGTDDLYSRSNPLYGRPPFTTDQLKYVQWGTGRIQELLVVFEYQFIEKERDYWSRVQSQS